MLSFEINRHLVDDIVVVRYADVCAAMRVLFEG